MNQPLQWLPDAAGTPWAALAQAMRDGLPVPNGFVVIPLTAEKDIRGAYEKLKIHEKTHFVAVRAPAHTVLNVIGPDSLVHTLRRLWRESPEAPILVQRMIHSTWCGKAQWHRKNLRVKANEGMLVLDPDTYLVNAGTGRCGRKMIEPKQRKMIRHVDGTARTVEREGDRTLMSADQLKSVTELTIQAKADIGWAIDDSDRVWLIGVP